MKNRTSCCFLVFLLFFVSTIAWSGEKKPVPLEIQLTILAGKVQLTRAGLPEPKIMTKSFPLYANDIIETLADSRAVLEYKDGTQMRLKPNSAVEVEENSLSVKKGKTWYKFTKRGTEFVISTPSLVAGIRGTEFELAVTTTGKSILSVISGSVAVRGSKGTEVLVNEGFGINCYPNLAPTNPYPISIEKKNKEWHGLEWLSTSDLEYQRSMKAKEYENAVKQFGAAKSQEIKNELDRLTQEIELRKKQ